MTRFHAGIGLAVIVVLPAYSTLSGSGRFAWTMFSQSALYRLELRAVDTKDGREQLRHMNPTELAVHAGRQAANYLAGADRWRHGPAARAVLLAHLDDVALLACRVARSEHVEVELFERRRLDAPVATHVVRRDCVR